MQLLKHLDEEHRGERQVRTQHVVGEEERHDSVDGDGRCQPARCWRSFILPSSLSCPFMYGGDNSSTTIEVWWHVIELLKIDISG